MPNTETGISSNEIRSSIQSSTEEFSRAHVFGCLVYVLDSALQDGHKIPKWSPRACLSLFHGFSDLHSSQVTLVLNVQTGKISPQYHVILTSSLKLSTLYQQPKVMTSNGRKSFAWKENASWMWTMTKTEMQFIHWCGAHQCGSKCYPT
jgi:hypothetical protein